MFIRQDGPQLEVLAPAKINLFLEVLGKRDDGFHELDMLRRGHDAQNSGEV